MAAGTARTAAAAAAAVMGLAVAVAAAALLSPAAAADFDDEEGTIACSLLSWRRRPEWSKRAQTTCSSHSFSFLVVPALNFFLLLRVVVVRCAVTALVVIRAALSDPSGVLGDWDDATGGDPCGWAMVTCNQGKVYELYAHSPCSLHASVLP